MPDGPPDRDTSPKELDIPTIPADEEPTPPIHPNYRRVTTHTPRSTAIQYLDEQQIVYHATRTASDADLRVVFEDIRKSAHDAEKAQLLVSVKINATRVAQGGIVAGYEDPQILPNNQIEDTHRQAVYVPGVQFYVPTEDPTVDDIRDALVHALSPQSTDYSVDI